MSIFVWVGGMSGHDHAGWLSSWGLED